MAIREILFLIILYTLPHTHGVKLGRSLYNKFEGDLLLSHTQ